ncbi:Ankyrin repeat family protein [Trifolium repens]|nr:Ankyrin repeat family protein [Trifolium repens]
MFGVVLTKYFFLRTTLEHLAKPRDEKELNRNRVLYRVDIKEDFLQTEEEEEKQMGKGNPQKSGPRGDLHTAARSGDLIAVQSILISNPLTVNSRDKHSRTPLHLAAFSGQTEVVSYLCKNKADVGASAMDDMAAIHFAAQKGHLEVVKALVSAGASFKSSTRKGVTPLHFAAQGSHLELVKYLAKKGASLTIKTKAGKTPLDLATNDEVRTFLEGFKKSDKNEESRNEDKAEGSDPKENEESDTKAAEESDPKASSSLGSEGNLSSEPPAAGVDEENGEREKRKSNEDVAREDSSQLKKAKVKLSHLQSSDDAQEENL